MNPCEGIREDLVAFTFGDLPARRMGEVGLHAGACHVCGAELKEIEGTLALSALWEAPGPADVPVYPPRRTFHWLRVRIPAMAAGLLLAAGVAAFLQGRRTPTPATGPQPPSPEQAVVLELLKEADRSDLADLLLGSCRAEEAVAKAPDLLPGIRAYVSDPSAYLSGRTRSGPPGLRNTALVLLARLAPLQALRELPQLLENPDATGDALRLLRQSGVDTSVLVPALLRAAKARGDYVLVNAATDLVMERGAAYPLRETLGAWQALGSLQTPALAEALETRTRRASTPELVAILRDSRDGAWAWAFSALAGRGDPAFLVLLEPALRDPARREAAAQALDRVPAGPLQARGYDIHAAWWCTSDYDAWALSKTLPMTEALGRRLARMGSSEGRRLLQRLQDPARRDAVLGVALREAPNATAILHLSATFGSPDLVDAVEARRKADPRVGGLARNVIGILEHKSSVPATPLERSAP